MDVLNKFLYSVAYKFPKGYPDINNEQDILMLENLLKERGISLSIKEGTKASNTRKAKEALINSPEGKEAGLTQMTATYRIGNKNKIDKDKFIEVINKVFNTPKLTRWKGSEENSNYNSTTERYSIIKRTNWRGDGTVSAAVLNIATQGKGNYTYANVDNSLDYYNITLGNYPSDTTDQKLRDELLSKVKKDMSQRKYTYTTEDKNNNVSPNNQSSIILA